MQRECNQCPYRQDPSLACAANHGGAGSSGRSTSSLYLGSDWNAALSYGQLYKVMASCLQALSRAFNCRATSSTHQEQADGAF
jgi:hypothetical protein